MNIKDLRNWISQLPAEFDDCELVYRKIFPVKTPDAPDTMMARDTPIVGATIDISTREACLYNKKSMKIVDSNQTDEPIKKL